MQVIFYIAAAIAIFATLMVITHKHAVHALLYLIVSLLAVAVIFYILGAPFAAALEVITYAGAIMVLFVFVVMMLNLGERTVEQESRWLSPSMWFGPGILAAALFLELILGMVYGQLGVARSGGVGPHQIGATLFGPYLIAVELAGMLLLGALVGAYHLGRQRRSHEEA